MKKRFVWTRGEQRFQRTRRPVFTFISFALRARVKLPEWKLETGQPTYAAVAQTRVKLDGGLFKEHR